MSFPVSSPHVSCPCFWVHWHPGSCTGYALGTTDSQMANLSQWTPPKKLLTPSYCTDAKWGFDVQDINQDGCWHNSSLVLKIKEINDVIICLSYHISWGRDKMPDILQTTFSDAFSSMEMFEFQLKFHWSLFLRVQLTISQYWFIIWTRYG